MKNSGVAAGVAITRSPKTAKDPERTRLRTITGGGANRNEALSGEFIAPAITVNC
jgi:hypothetical protein